MKTHIAVAVAAVVGTLMLVAGIVGMVYAMQYESPTVATGNEQVTGSAAVELLSEVWNETEPYKQDAICEGYRLDPGQILYALVDGNEAALTYDEANQFLDANCP